MDVNTTFLHGDIKEEIYMKHPQGFVMKGNDEGEKSVVLTWKNPYIG